MINPFADSAAAYWYAQGRPFYHEGALAAVAMDMGWTAPLAGALDVCCGTGLSTVALLPYAEHVVGVDAAAEMLAEATPHPHITYLQAPAEALPFADAAFDLLTICEGFHWLDQNRFLDEAYRVLRPGAVLLIYGGGIRDVMDEVPAFTDWFKNVHLPRYPNAKKGASFWERERHDDRFAVRREGTHEKPIPFTVARLADFFLSVSNTRLLLEETGQSYEDHRQFLIADLLPFFAQDQDAVHQVRYGGRYTVLTRAVA